ncbi:MAG: hypothetical protein A2751_00560 [Candidatus Doudnabacteria bacterium RIFCSPHIGHO2_01_FULL_46_14]|uniref:N-acetyltransferase domain-containing protein n=1 Tax=Candidatus Doudnabacteria bacterium RIFCSPHIGHO2_01_FULL_46_14 TaxID=1817824 RepID=A0A1F5NJF4_9BACT|nr:MAG: hypothetical protein A2751_00560 [Candidatus Doudnabacteria bacterium RIFCSPHIGHO2_01_FULL_46_14]
MTVALKKLKKWFINYRKRSNALKQFSNNSCYDIDLKLYLDKFFKFFPSNEGDNELKQDFSLIMSSGTGYNDAWLGNGPYRDASYTIALYKSKHKKNVSGYLCCIGFDVQKVTKSEIVVKQIQGSFGKEGLLRLFKWERMMLKVLTDWASQNGFKKIWVIMAKNSFYYNRYGEDRKKRMYMHYDITARRSGFSFDETNKQYFKVLD